MHDRAPHNLSRRDWLKRAGCGAGEDRYILPGPEAEYEVTPESDAWRVTGPLGSARLAGVEILEFGDGATRRLD